MAIFKTPDQLHSMAIKCFAAINALQRVLPEKIAFHVQVDFVYYVYCQQL